MTDEVVEAVSAATASQRKSFLAAFGQFFEDALDVESGLAPNEISLMSLNNLRKFVYGTVGAELILNGGDIALFVERLKVGFVIRGVVFEPGTRH